MLDSTLDLITQAASNPHMLFCFCNFIIAILLVNGSSKPSSGLKAGPGEESVNSEKPEEVLKIVENEERWAPQEGDDELKRRAEEFIEKINRGWRAEKVKTNLFGAMA